MSGDAPRPPWANLTAVEVGEQLIDAEQRLARVPDLERELEEANLQIKKLREEREYFESTLREVTHSPSWRLTAPLRNVRRGLRRSAAPQ